MLPDISESGSLLLGDEAAETAIPAVRHTGHRTSFAIPSSADELLHAKGRWDDDSWQLKALAFINSDPVQKILVCLLVLDVLVLFTELAIDVYVPLCPLVIRDAISCCPGHHDNEYAASTMRILSVDDSHGVCTSPLVDTAYEAGCDTHKYNGAHVAHQLLFWITIVILTTFQVELCLLIYLIGPAKFFRQVFYVIDLFVVTCSLFLELLYRFGNFGELDWEILPEILIMFRLWRFVRIGHGLVASTHEIGEHKTHLAVEHIGMLEERLESHGGKLPERPDNLKAH